MSNSAASWPVLALSLMLLPAAMAACSGADEAAPETTRSTQSKLEGADGGDAGPGVVVPVVLVDAGNPGNDCSNANPRDLTACMACCSSTADRLYPLQAPENAEYRALCQEGCVVGPGLNGTAAPSATIMGSPTRMP